MDWKLDMQHGNAAIFNVDMHRQVAWTAWPFSVDMSGNAAWKSSIDMQLGTCSMRMLISFHLASLYSDVLPRRKKAKQNPLFRF
jgi:hypothetical protein